MNKLLTVIVPAYNMEHMLEENLKSLIIPDNYFDKLEVIVINDGSKDKTLNIAKKFEVNYPSVFMTIDKENGNYGSCVNAGIKIANGTFIKIMDADDRFNGDALLQILYEVDKSEDNNEEIDMFFNDWHSVDSNYSVINEYKKDIPPLKAIDIVDTRAVEYFKNIQHHAIIYRTSLLRKMNYIQTEGVSYTDQEWISLPLFEVKRIKYLPFDLYIYYLGRSGQTMDKDVVREGVDAHLIIARNLITKFNYYKDDYLELNQLIVEQRVLALLKSIYVIYLLGCNYEYKIRSFDDCLKNNNKDVFDKMNEIKLGGKIGFKFIKIWRESPRGIRYKCIRKLYSCIRK